MKFNLNLKIKSSAILRGGVLVLYREIMKKRNNIYIMFFLLLIFYTVGVGSILAADYRLQQDDQLGISVWGHPDLGSEVSVGPDGMVSLPLVTNIKVEGLTTTEVSKLLTDKYAEYLKNPQVNVLLMKYRKTRVMVLGEVKNPGTYQLEENRRLLELISLAGGPTESAVLEEVRLTRGEEVKVFNLKGLLEGTTIEGNYLLEDGDVIYLPEGIIEVTIMGEVRNPGRYKLESEMKLTDLLATAGGVTEKAALELEYTTSDNLEKIKIAGLLKGSLKEIPRLSDGDMVYIPEGNFEVSILGEVQRPGTYDWTEGLRLTDLLARAGNQTENGDIKEVQVIHRNNDTDFYNLSKYFKEGDLANNPNLQAGDSIYLARGDFEVTVLGEVKKPGSYTWREGQRLSDILAVAGNQTETGDLSRIRISSQNNVSQYVDLKKYINEGNLAANPKIEAGDSIHISKKVFEVSILGEVNSPGIYSWHQELRLDKLLAEAGNQTERGDIENIKILHQDGTSREINLEEYFEDSTTGENPLLKPGDTIKLEEVKGLNWQKVFTYVAGAKLIKDFLNIEW